MDKTKLMMIVGNYQYANYLRRLVDYDALGFEVAGIEYNGALGLEQFREYQPQVVFLDASIPIIGVDQFIQLMQRYTMDFVVVLLDDCCGQEANNIQHIYSVLPKTGLTAAALTDALRAALLLLDRPKAREGIANKAHEYYERLTGVVGDGQFTMERMYRLRNEFGWPLTSMVHLLLLRPAKPLARLSSQFLNDMQQQLDAYGGGALVMMDCGGVLIIINAIEGNERFNPESLYDRLLSELAYIARTRHEMQFCFLLGSACKLSGLTKQYETLLSLYPLPYYIKENSLIRAGALGPPLEPPASLAPLILKVLEGLLSSMPLDLTQALQSIYLSILKLSRQPALTEKTRRRLAYLYATMAALIDGGWAELPACFTGDYPYIENECAAMEAAFGALRERLALACPPLNTLTCQAIALMLAGLSSNISLKTVADAINVTPSYLSHLFKKELGLTFSDYLTDIRIMEARHMISHSSKKVYEVAAEVGFSDYRYFGNVFRKQTGMTPSEYRAATALPALACRIEDDN